MMRYATDSDLTTRVPATASVAEATRATALFDATAQINVTQYGDRALRAHVMLAAHYLAVEGLIAGADSGQVASKSIGGLSVSYSTSAPDDPQLGSTRYGREFLAIRSTLVSYAEAL